MQAEDETCVASRNCRGAEKLSDDAVEIATMEMSGEASYLAPRVKDNIIWRIQVVGVMCHM